ncbi:MAG: type IV pilus assembly protein PilM [Salinibacterium sp.]|uniref:Pilus assembly protein PilM n=1 Tax=Marisediminicola antarctica TaxID=674079 RepID=A0A7L5AGA8_9MICO|nr:type IV pilus assembly protein PilM [Marisediminicola antarctica]MCY7413087.1 type IV pilus assembly protein PilM [Salinibacterium sp.]QHO69022.1 pilus assembly protein PilM [Marisediminicola antarctica]
MGTRTVGVDIGSGSIRAVEVSRGKRGSATVVRYHSVPLPEGAVKNGEVAEVNTVAAALRQLWSVGGFTSRKVVLGVGNPKVLVRDLTVPKLSKKEIRAALPFQVQDMLPVPVADALLDFYPVSEGSSETGPVVNGLLVAAVKDAVMSNVTAVMLAGLTPIEVDLIPFALNRVLARGSMVGGTVALVDVGSNTTNVLITKDGVPQFVRIIPAGGADVTRALAGRLGITLEQAEVGKRQLGFSPGAVAPENLEAAEIIYELTSELLNSLRSTLSFFVNTRPGQHIDRVLLSGGGSSMTSFALALAELTRSEVLLDDPFENVTVGKNARKQSLPAVNTSAMTVALGLALRSVA